MDAVCRLYQRQFRHSHPEQEKLVALHRVGFPSGEMAEYLEAYFAHEFEKGLSAVERFAGITREWEGGRALDFGCGGGGLTYRIRERTASAVGIDLDPQKLDFARSQAARLGVDQVEFVQYPGGTPTPLPAGGFDVIFCIDVVEHLPTPEKFFAEFRRLLRPGGLLLLSFGPPWGHPHGKHMWSQLPGWWTHLLFPRPVVMRVSGHPANTTWESLGLHRLTVRHFERVVRQSGFKVEYQEYGIHRRLKLLKRVPGVRELFVSEVVGVYRNPA